MIRTRIRQERGVAVSRLRARRHLATILLYVIATGVLIFGSIFLIRSSIFRLNNVRALGLEHISPDSVENLVKGEIENNYLWVIPKSHSLFYPRDTIANAIYSQFPRARKVSLDSTGGLLEISIGEYPERYVWCGNKCYFMTDKGELFAEVPTSTAHLIFKRSGNEKKKIGDLVIDEGFLERTLELVKLFSKDDLLVKEITQNGKDVTLLFHSGWMLYFDTTDTPLLVYEKARKILELEPVAHAAGNLEYIDLRFGKKVYYKLQNE